MNINKLSIDELYELNRKVVQRIKVLNSRKQEDAASQFGLKDRVFFVRKNGERIEGEIVKINRKTVKVQTNFGLWSVSPTLLQRS